jgi:hypothetical protein
MNNLYGKMYLHQVLIDGHDRRITEKRMDKSRSTVKALTIEMIGNKGLSA